MATQSDVRDGIVQRRCQFQMDEPLAKDLEAAGARQTPPLTFYQMILKACSREVNYHRDQHLPKETALPKPMDEPTHET